MKQWTIETKNDLNSMLDFVDAYAELFNDLCKQPTQEAQVETDLAMDKILLMGYSVQQCTAELLRANTEYDAVAEKIQRDLFCREVKVPDSPTLEGISSPE